MSSTRHSRRLAASLATSLLLAASFPIPDEGWIAWFALVPLFLAMRGERPRLAAATGWLAGFVFFLLSISWVADTVSNFTTIPPVLAYGLLVLLAAGSAWVYGALAASVEWLAARGIARVVSAPIVWVVFEWMRTFVVAEFPWNLLGYTQIDYLPIAQAADLGGVYLLSAAIVLVNAALADALVALRGGAAWSAGIRSIALAAFCPLLLFVYGQWRLAGLENVAYTGSIRIGVTQGNIEQDQKWDAALSDRILATYLDLTRQAAGAGARLVVWPEAALPFAIGRDMRTVELARIASGLGIDLLVGAPGVEDRDGKGPKPYNQAWLVRADGSFVGPYDKIQLVPFGEYIPLYGLFGMIDIAVEAVGQLGRGEEHTIFETLPLEDPSAPPGTATSGRPARVAALICYEGIFPTLTREFAAAGADVLINISNDAWYGDTSAPHQHLAMAAMRAIENRLPLVRSTNTGISAFVTDEGRIGSTTPLFHEDIAVETVLTRDVWSFYREYGDVFLHACQLAAAALLVVGWRRKKLGTGTIS